MKAPPKDIIFQSEGNKMRDTLWVAGSNKPMVIMLYDLEFHTFECKMLAALFDFRGHDRSERRRSFWALLNLADGAKAVIDYINSRFKGKICYFRQQPKAIRISWHRALAAPQKARTSHQDIIRIIYRFINYEGAVAWHVIF